MNLRLIKSAYIRVLAKYKLHLQTLIYSSGIQTMAHRPVIIEPHKILKMYLYIIHVSIYCQFLQTLKKCTINDKCKVQHQCYHIRRRARNPYSINVSLCYLQRVARPNWCRRGGLRGAESPSCDLKRAQHPPNLHI